MYIIHMVISLHVHKYMIYLVNTFQVIITYTLHLGFIHTFQYQYVCTCTCNLYKYVHIHVMSILMYMYM